MKTDQLYQKLISAAKSAPPSTEVPYGFEHRVLAQLRAGLRIDPWLVWSGQLWRAAYLSLAAMLLCGAFMFMVDLRKTTANSLADDLEETVMAGIGSGGNVW
jgi:hypothetical protein